MIKVSIIRDGKITNEASFPTREEADKWLGYHESSGSFGQPKQIVQQQIELEPAVIEKQMVLVKEAQLDEQGMEITPAEFEEIDVVVKEAVTEMCEVELAGDYEVIIEDISTKIEQEKINAEALAFLAATDYIIIRAMERGEQVSPEIKTEREAARNRIIK